MMAPEAMMRKMLLAMVVLSLTAAASAQSQPATRASAAPAGMPKNLDNSLQAAITLDASGAHVSEFIDSLRKITQTNIEVNWNALALAGVTHDTPITLQVKDVSYEAVVRALMEILPAGKDGGGTNYTVGDNILEITTNGELGKGPEPRLRSVDHAMSFSLYGAVAGADERAANGKLLEAIFLAELRRAGEPMDARGHSLVIRDGTLAASVSDRGLAVVEHAIADFNVPVKLGQIADGTQFTAPAKRAAEAVKGLDTSNAGYIAMAREPEKYKEKISIALLPGTAEELAKERPAIEGAISDGGILMLGPRAAVRRRTLMAVYDLRGLIKKIAAKNKVNAATTAEEVQAAIVQILQTTLKPDGDGKWLSPEELAKEPRGSCLVAYPGAVVVFATAQTHRTVAGALVDMGK